MKIIFEGVLYVSAILAALIAIVTALMKCVSWYLEQKKQSAEIKRIKEENELIVLGLSACLDGLSQLGANHTVTTAKNRLDTYINKQAHK